MTAGAPTAGLAEQLFAVLADGALHSGEQIAARLGVTRSAVWKGIENLRRLGMDILARRHEGYRLQRAITPLQALAITQQVPAALRPLLHGVEVRWSLPSTNAEMLARTSLPAGQCDVLLAEHQSAGRGRRARQWFAAPGSALCLSLGWLFPVLPADSAALSLAVGVAVLRALRTLSGPTVQLKWPNDLVVAGRKLGGVLIELRAEAGGPAYVVVGLGLNVALPAAVSSAIEASGTAPVDLAALGCISVDRNRLAGLIVAELLDCLRRFERDGFAPFRDEWQAADALRGQPVAVTGPGISQAGKAAGIEADGALRLQTATGVMRVVSGEVSLRPTP